MYRKLKATRIMCFFMNPLCDWAIGWSWICYLMFLIIREIHYNSVNRININSTSWEMMGWMKHKLESRLPGEIPIISWQKAKKTLDGSKRGEWKSWLKAQHSEDEDHGIWSYHFMENRWGNSVNSDRLYFFRLQNHCRW